MDYRVASNIRGKSLSSLITDKITSGGSIGSSIRSSISDKLKAKGTGIKEKFDPMNIARAMTGGSRLAPAILGRLTGRSQADINYFAGDKRKGGSYTQIPTATSTPGEGLGGSAVEVLNRMLSFMQKSREDDLTKKETAKAFQEEQRVEDQRRHNEFLDVLKEYTSLSGGTTTLVKKEEGEGFFSGIMSTIKSMISTAVAGIMSTITGIGTTIAGILTTIGSIGSMISTAVSAAIKIALAGFDALKPLFKFAGNIVKFVASPLFRVLLNPYMLGFATAYTLANYLASILPDYTKISPEEAKNALENGSERDIEKLGGREYLQTIISNYNDTLKEGEEPVKFTPQTATQLRNISPRPDTTGGKNKARAMNWDKKFGETHNPDGTPKVTTTAKPLLSGVEESTAEAGRGTAVLDDYKARELEQETGGKAAFGVRPMGITPKTTAFGVRPMGITPQTTVSSRMDNAFEEYQALNMVPPGNTQTTPAVLTTNTSTVDLPDRPIPATATVRDKTPILDHVLQLSMSPI